MLTFKYAVYSFEVCNEEFEVNYQNSSYRIRSLPVFSENVIINILFSFTNKFRTFDDVRVLTVVMSGFIL
jgi:hypothetical protein